MRELWDCAASTAKETYLFLHRVRSDLHTYSTQYKVSRKVEVLRLKFPNTSQLATLSALARRTLNWFNIAGAAGASS